MNSIQWQAELDHAGEQLIRWTGKLYEPIYALNRVFPYTSIGLFVLSVTCFASALGFQGRMRVIVMTLSLYCLGGLIMMRVMRDSGLY